MERNTAHTDRPCRGGGVDLTALRREWEVLAPRWISEVREGTNSVREGMLDDLMLEACGDVTGMRVLDSGCGEGRFSRILAARGAAYVLGVDLCEPMVAAAKELATGRDEYVVGDVQSLTFLADASFDLAISYLNQCDLPDFAANTREVYRILKGGSRFVVANLHPMRSAPGQWQRGGAGEKLHVAVDHYFDEGPRRFTMMGMPLTNFHRTLSTYVNTFLGTGFTLERLIEPTVRPEVLSRYPDLDDELRVPNFIIYVLRKEGRRGVPVRS